MAGSALAPGQTGFIMHFDSVQAGKSGSGVAVREVADGYLVFARQFSHNTPGWQHIFSRKVSLTGEMLAEREYRIGDTVNYAIGSIDPLSDGLNGTYWAAIREDFNYDGIIWLYQFDSSGDTIQRKYLISYPAQDSVSFGIRQTRKTSDGGFIQCGFYQSVNNLSQALLIRLDSNADTIWTQKLGLAQQTEILLGVEEYPDGGFIVTGYKLDGTPWNSSLLMRTNSLGQVLWTRYFGETGGTNTAVKITPDGDIVTWTTYAQNNWPTDTYQRMITTWNPNGDIIWQQRSDSSYFSTTWDMEQLADGSFICTGASLAKPVLSKFNCAGDSLWSRSYTVTNDLHYLYDVEPTSDGGFVATGEAWRYIPLDSAEFHQSQTIFVIKTDSLGCVIPGCHTVGVEEYALDMNEYLTVYPNPVAQGGSLNIAFNPPPEYKPKGHLRVVVLDAMGKRVLEQPFTDRATPLNNLRIGMYYLHLTDDTTWLAGSAFVVE